MSTCTTSRSRERIRGGLLLGPVVLLSLSGFIGCEQSRPADEVASNVEDHSSGKSIEPAAPAPQPLPPGRANAAGQERILPIVIQPPEINIGVVPPGQVAHGEVEILNIGDEPIKILRSTPSCQCTSVDLASQVIAPRSKIILPAEFDGGHRLGARNGTIQLIFEGYDQVIEVPVLAEIALPVRAIPDIIRNQVPNTTDYVDTLPFTVESVDGRPFRILAVQEEPPAFIDFDPAQDEPRNSYQLRFDFTRYDKETCLDEEGRPMPSFLVVETDHPDCPVFDIRVRHDCTLYERTDPGQNWTLADRRALLGVLAPGEPAEFTVSLVWRPGTTPDDQISDVVTNSAQFSAELLEAFREDGKMTYRVRITPAPDFRGLLYDTVRFQSTRFDMSMLIIGLVREGASRPGASGS